ncbi:VOC family protein [Nocardioides sp.]|uniref:VOC family protein n=1 Tax=Nocardioides sp. TaxID=35761 RepID=UPI003519B7CA
MPIATAAVHHVRLTVRDLAASRRFYDTLFGWDVAYELPADADEATREQLWFLFGGVIYATPWGLFGLRPVAAGEDAFSEDRVGLDHLALGVPSRDDLEAAAVLLAELGAPHEEIKDIGAAWLLEFRDPDGIALELAAPKA